MQALRQFHTAEQGMITIQLPNDFPTDEVEIIILPKEPESEGKAEEPSGESSAIQRFLAMDTSRLSPEQKWAYERTCAHLSQHRVPGSARTLGLFEGLIEIADNFDEPLSDIEIDLFYGADTDEYGLSLPS